MNVGATCRAIPAYLPHELLGYNKDSLMGTMLTFKILDAVITKENEASGGGAKGQQSSRIAKFNKLK